MDITGKSTLLQTSSKNVFLFCLLIVVLPLHSLLTFSSFLLWDNYLFIKTIAAWKEIIILFLFGSLFRRIDRRKKITILLGLLIINLLLQINQADFDTILRFNRSFGLFFIFFSLGSNYSFSPLAQQSILNAIRLSLFIIVAGGIIDYVFHFGDLLSKYRYMEYSVNYLRVDEGEFNQFTRLPHTYYTDGVYRIGSFVLHPLGMGIILVMYYPFIVFSYFNSKKWIDLCLGLLTVICIFISFSRSPLIILLVMSTAIYFIHVGKINIPGKYYVYASLILILAYSTNLFSQYMMLISATVDLTDPSAIARTASYMLTFDAFSASPRSILFGSPQFNYFSESEILSALAITGIVGFLLILGRSYYQLRLIFVKHFDKTKSASFLFACLVSGLGYLSFALINPMFTSFSVAVIGGYLLGLTQSIGK